jgi:ParB family transcriptional regulator, chromosome partitioning protein
MAELKNYENLNPLERGKLFKRIKEDENLSYKELADKISKSSSYVANSIRLLDLPVAIKDGLLGGVVSEGHARALASLENPQECISVYKDVLKNHSTVRETEDLVKQKRNARKKKLQINQEQAETIKEGLEQILGKKINKIESTSSVNKITLEIFIN